MGWKPGIWEIVLVLVIVLVIFGPGRLGKLGKDLGKGFREFRRGLTGKEEGEEETEEEG